MPEGFFSQRTLEASRSLEHIGHFPEQFLPAIKTKTKVLVVDGDISTDIGLGVGLPAPMGLMLRPENRGLPIDIPQNGMLGVMNQHGRSGNLPRFPRLKQSHRRIDEPEEIARSRNFVTYVDSRGCGKHGDKDAPTGWRYGNRIGRPYEGLDPFGAAYKDWKLSNKFRKLGCLLHVPVAIVETHELPIVKNGVITLAPIHEADTKRIMRGMSRPVFFLRGYLSKSRIQDVRALFEERQIASHEALRQELDSVRETLGYYTNNDGPLSPAEYITWFASRLAKTFGVFHKEGYRFVGVHPHNFTLAGEVVDADMMEKDKRSFFETTRETRRRLEAYAFELKGLPGGVDGVFNQVRNLHTVLTAVYPEQSLPEIEKIRTAFEATYLETNKRGKEIVDTSFGLSK